MTLTNNTGRQDATVRATTINQSPPKQVKKNSNFIEEQ